jgi:hypothetical protein
MRKDYFKQASQILVLSTGLLFTFCAPPKEVEKLTLLEKATINSEDTLVIPTKREGDAHGGKFYSQADSIYQYANGYVFNIHDSLNQKDLRVKLNTWVRLGDLNHDQKYGIALEDGKGKMLHWTEVNFRSHVAEANKWINVTDSVTIPGNLINMSGMILKTFTFNPDAKSFLDCDDTELSFYKLEKVIEK